MKLLKEKLNFNVEWSIYGVVMGFSMALSGETVGDSMKKIGQWWANLNLFKSLVIGYMREAISRKQRR